MSEKKKEANVKLVRLLSGEDIVADVEEKEHSVVLTNPITIALVGGQPGQAAQAVCQPWLLFSVDNFVELHERFVMYVKPPVDQFYKQWKSIFEPSRIITPGDSGVVVPELKVQKK